MVLYGYSGGTQTLDIDTRACGNGKHSNANEHPGEFERVYGPYKILTNQCFVFIFYNLTQVSFHNVANANNELHFLSSYFLFIMFLKCYQLQNFMKAEANNKLYDPSIK